MRIQETDRIIKETRHSRHAQANQHEQGIVSRAWQAVTSIPTRMAGMFKHRDHE